MEEGLTWFSEAAKAVVTRQCWPLKEGVATARHSSKLPRCVSEPKATPSGTLVEESNTAEGRASRSRHLSRQDATARPLTAEGPVLRLPQRLRVLQQVRGARGRRGGALESRHQDPGPRQSRRGEQQQQQRLHRGRNRTGLGPDPRGPFKAQIRPSSFRSSESTTREIRLTLARRQPPIKKPTPPITAC